MDISMRSIKQGRVATNVMRVQHWYMGYAQVTTDIVHIRYFANPLKLNIPTNISERGPAANIAQSDLSGLFNHHILADISNNNSCGYRKGELPDGRHQQFQIALAIGNAQ